MILENLKTAGVQQAHKDDKISFTSLIPWPGDLICAEGRYRESESDSSIEKRAAIFIGPEFGTVSRPDLVSAAREAGDANGTAGRRLQLQPGEITVVHPARRRVMACADSARDADIPSDLQEL